MPPRDFPPELQRATFSLLLFFSRRHSSGSETPPARLLLPLSPPATRHLPSFSVLALYLCMTSPAAGQPPEGNQTKPSGFSGPRAALVLNNRLGGNHPVLVPVPVPALLSSRSLPPRPVPVGRTRWWWTFIFSNGPVLLEIGRLWGQMNDSLCLPLCSCLTLAAPVSTKAPALSLLFNKGDSPSRHCLLRPPRLPPPLATVPGDDAAACRLCSQSVFRRADSSSSEIKQVGQ